MVFGRRSASQARSAEPPPQYSPPPRPAPPPSQMQQQRQQPPHVNGVEEGQKSRRSSFNFLRRSKSSDDYTKHVIPPPKSGRSLLRRRRNTLSEEEAAKQNLNRETAREPPSLPSPRAIPDIVHHFQPSSPDQQQTRKLQNSYPPSAFPGSRQGHVVTGFYNRFHNMDNSSVSTFGTPTVQGSSVDFRPESHQHSQAMDSHARSESMTNRGRYSYASSAVSHVNSPRRVRRRKDPTPFNILVIGTKNCGKTSFIDFLRTSLTQDMTHRPSTPSPPPANNHLSNHGSFTSQYLETELEGERIGLTLYDSKGLERHLVDLQLREIASFLESKFAETFQEEQKVLRATGVRDTHIHCVFLILDPSRLDSNIAAEAPNAHRHGDELYASKPKIIGGLDEALDVDILRTLEGKTTVIPVISKADTITTAHMTYLKRTVWNSLKKVNFDPLEALHVESDNESDYETAYEPTLREVDETGSPDADRDAGSNNPFDNIDAQPSNGVSNKKHGTTSSVDSSKMPQHAELRVSQMSESVELPYLPMSIISPDVYEPDTLGRRFPWGFADPYNADHCDFVKLKDSVFSEWRVELRGASRERWYENWRTSRLKNRRGGQLPVPAPRGANATSRAVSGAAAYGLPQKINGYGQAPARAASSSQIGVAIGGQS